MDNSREACRVDAIQSSTALKQLTAEHIGSGGPMPSSGLTHPTRPERTRPECQQGLPLARGKIRPGKGPTYLASPVNGLCSDLIHTAAVNF